MDELMLQSFIFILGSLFGSFANVIIYRLPKKESIVSPRSYCYNCKKQIPFYFNIPIVSWLVLAGQCKFCKRKISMRYFIVELLMAWLFVLAYQKFGLSITFIESLIFIFGLVTISMIDFDHYIIPNVFTYSGVVIVFIGSFINSERTWQSSLIGILVGGGFLYFVSYMYYLVRKKVGLGGGDIKLLAWVGGLLGFVSLPFVIMFSSLAGSLVGIVLMLKTKSGLNQKLAFGPYISLGAILFLFWGENILKLFFNFSKNLGI